MPRSHSPIPLAGNRLLAARRRSDAPGKLPHLTPATREAAAVLEARVWKPRPLPKLFLLSLKVDQGAARAAGRRVPAEKGIGGGGGVGRAGAAPRWTGPAAAGARRGDGGRSPGGDCGAWNRRGRGGAWLGRGEAARPLPAAPAAARAREVQRSAPRLLPLLSLLREILVCGETGSPGGLRLSKPTHVSFKPFVAAFTRRRWKRRGNKGGDAEPARLEARDGRDMLIPQRSEPARPVPEPRCGREKGEARAFACSRLRPLRLFRPGTPREW